MDKLYVLRVASTRGEALEADLGGNAPILSAFETWEGIDVVPRDVAKLIDRDTLLNEESPHVLQDEAPVHISLGLADADENGVREAGRSTAPDPHAQDHGPGDGLPRLSI
ncbi:MAG: hypothetical protein NTW68_08465 [candidate division NC10 bacterium]|nr:hypothetical protein [candidate division NC10 bacterium]